MMIMNIMNMKYYEYEYYEYENFRKLKLKFNEKNILTFFFRFLIDGTFNRYNELYKSEM